MKVCWTSEWREKSMFQGHRGSRLRTGNIGPYCNHVQMWELDHKEGWVPENWCFWTVVLEKTLQRPLDCKIKPVNLKGNLGDFCCFFFVLFCCFLRNVSWNLILLILSSLLALSPALKLEVLADVSALARYCSACRTNSLILKDLSLQLSCDDLQTSRRILNPRVLISVLL